ncbi:uncharacterized protein LOC62_01G001564 [Vanrija pseudolonga]|uniref:Uncharacterized protein n=1 Tax=Vanrija pseudolonga TaxID=143232 RepID=A0AAF0Y152_9TREE|nr:hypothetical protein LOC62_01G001564 [Vanrija pseudolonga]
MPPTRISDGPRYTTVMGNKVHRLRKADDWLDWLRGVNACLMPKRAHAQMYIDEPYRCSDESNHISVYRPQYGIAGNHPPHGQQLSPASGPIPDNWFKSRWATWRKSEFLARSVFLLTVDTPLIIQVEDLWCVKDMFYALHALLFPNEAHDYNAKDLYRKLREMLLDDGASAEAMTRHFQDFYAILVRRRNMGYPISNESSLSLFFLSIQGDLRVRFEAAFVAKCPLKNNWRDLWDLFKTEIEAKRRLEVEEVVEAEVAEEVVAEVEAEGSVGDENEGSESEENEGSEGDEEEEEDIEDDGYGSDDAEGEDEVEDGVVFEAVPAEEAPVPEEGMAAE